MYSVMSNPITLATLEAAGFEGFFTIGQVHRESAMGVPDERGVYLVLVRGDAPHEIRARSSAPVWRGQDPAESVEALTERWVADAVLLYAASANGPGVRHRLRQRLKRFLRFGHGKVVGHWSGRAIWQLREASRLVLAWRVCAPEEDPRAITRELLESFEHAHGRLPFANRAEDVPDDGEDATD